MLHGTISMPSTAASHYREKSHSNMAYRSKSQPAVESRLNFLSPSTSTMNNPMRNFFGNLLQLSPYRYVSSINATTNRSKISSSLSTTNPSERSSKFKHIQPSVVSSFSIRSTNIPSSYERQIPQTKLTIKFRRTGNLILFAIYWCKFARKKNLSRSLVYQSYLQTATTTGKYMFDKLHFKIQSFEILPVIRDFFQQPIDKRDLTNIDQVRRCLNDMKSFTRLPTKLQDQLLQKARYESYPEQRTIVRQGERSNCFYIILSGSVIPTYKRAIDGNVETLDVLKRGSTFGEKGLMTNSTQSFTITSKTPLELLVLWKDDFQAIYMTNDRQCSDDDLKFLKTQVPILHGYPIDRLYEIPNAIQHCHFRSSEVIAKDSRRMKHIYIVKKGSLAIWKRLDPNGADRETTKNLSEEFDSNHFNHQDEATGDNRTLFSEVQLSGDTNEFQASTNALDADFRLTRLRRSLMDDQRLSSASSRTVVTDNKKFPGLIDKRDRLQLVDYDSLSNHNNLTKLTLSNALEKRNRSSRRTLTKPKLIPPDKMTYVHVKTLNQGQQFGILDMFFPNQPELTLVSNECECLLLNKSSFLQLVSDQYKQNIRRSEIPFPIDSVFYKTYHTNEIWKRFSKQVYLDAYERINQQHPQTMKYSRNRNEQKTAPFQPILIGAS